MSSPFQNFTSPWIDGEAVCRMRKILEQIEQDLEDSQKANEIGRALLCAIESETADENLSWIERRRRARTRAQGHQFSAEEIDTIIIRAVEIAQGKCPRQPDEVIVRVLKTLATIGGQSDRFRFTIDEGLTNALSGSAANGRFFQQKRDAENLEQVIIRLRNIFPKLKADQVPRLWQTANEELASEWTQPWAKPLISPIVLPKPSRLASTGTRQAAFNQLAKIMIGWQAGKRQQCRHWGYVGTFVEDFSRPKNLELFGHPRTEEAIQRLETEQPGDFLVIPAMEDFHRSSARRAETLFGPRQFALGVFESLAVDMIFGIRDHHRCAGDAVWKPDDFHPQRWQVVHISEEQWNKLSPRMIPELSTWWYYYLTPPPPAGCGRLWSSCDSRPKPPNRGFVGLNRQNLVRSDLVYTCNQGVGWLTAFLPKSMRPLQTSAFLTDQEWKAVAKKTS